MNPTDVTIASESLPRSFTADFIPRASGTTVSVYVDNHACGDTITDNSYENDYYRYHDVFHLTYAARLGWSPCMRAMLRRKRKSNSLIDEVEDGARAQITEEAIALMIFVDAKTKDFYAHGDEVDSKVLDLVMAMCHGIEPRSVSRQLWREAIEESYRLFRLLITNGGGRVQFDADRSLARFESIVK